MARHLLMLAALAAAVGPGCIEEKILVGGGDGDGGGGSPDASLFDARPGPDATPYDAPPGDAPDPCSACPETPSGYFRACGRVYDLRTSEVIPASAASDVRIELWDAAAYGAPGASPLEILSPDASCQRFVTGAHPTPSQGSLLVVLDGPRTTVSFGGFGSGAFDDAVAWDLDETGYLTWQNQVPIVSFDSANLATLVLVDSTPLPPLPGRPQAGVQVTTDSTTAFVRTFLDPDPLKRDELGSAANAATGPNGSVLVTATSFGSPTATVTFVDPAGYCYPSLSLSPNAEMNGVMVVFPLARMTCP